jgi:hypothetical protein
MGSLPLLICAMNSLGATVGAQDNNTIRRLPILTWLAFDPSKAKEDRGATQHRRVDNEQSAMVFSVYEYGTGKHLMDAVGCRAGRRNT